MIGVVKQESQGGELKQIDTIQFGRGTIKSPEPEYPVYEDFDVAMSFGGGGGSRTRSGGIAPPSPMVNPQPVAYDMEMMAEEDSTAADAGPLKSIPTLETLTGYQDISGYWQDDAEDILMRFFKCNCIDDPDVKAQFPKTRAYLTFVAIYVLEVKFEDNEDEWYYLVKKGKDYLKTVGIDSKTVKSLIKQFELELKED